METRKTDTEKKRRQNREKWRPNGPKIEKREKMDKGGIET